MFVTFEKAGHKYLVPVVEAHEHGGVLTIATPPDAGDGVVDVIDAPGFTMADLVQSMNAASQRGDCVAVLQSYRPKATP